MAVQAVEPTPAPPPPPLVLVKTPPPKRVAETDFHSTESVQAKWTIYPPEGTTREDLLAPTFWQHVARKLSPMNVITACPKDGEWYGEFLVLYVNGTEVKVKELRYVVLSTETQDIGSDYFVAWISPPVRFGVKRKSDGALLKANFQSKADAERWMADNEKALK